MHAYLCIIVYVYIYKHMYTRAFILYIYIYTYIISYNIYHMSYSFICKQTCLCVCYKNLPARLPAQKKTRPEVIHQRLWTLESGSLPASKYHSPCKSHRGRGKSPQLALHPDETGCSLHFHDHVCTGFCLTVRSG